MSLIRACWAASSATTSSFRRRTTRASALDQRLEQGEDLRLVFGRDDRNPVGDGAVQDWTVAHGALLARNRRMQEEGSPSGVHDLCHMSPVFWGPDWGENSACSQILLRHRRR